MRELPADWRSPSAAILAPVAGELGDDWANAFSAETVVAVGVQGLVRELTAGGAVRALPLRRTALIERAQMLQLSAEDVAGGAPPLAELLDMTRSWSSRTAPRALSICAVERAGTCRRCQHANRSIRRARETCSLRRGSPRGCSSPTQSRGALY